MKLEFNLYVLHELIYSYLPTNKKFGCVEYSHMESTWKSFNKTDTLEEIETVKHELTNYSDKDLIRDLVGESVYDEWSNEFKNSLAKRSKSNTKSNGNSKSKTKSNTNSKSSYVVIFVILCFCLLFFFCFCIIFLCSVFVIVLFC